MSARIKGAIKRASYRSVSKALKLSLGDMAAVRNEGRAEGYRKGLADAAKAAEAAWPRAHTYASENADLYRAQDEAVAVVVAAIRKLGEDA